MTVIILNNPSHIICSLFSETVEIAIIGGVFGLEAIVLHHEYPLLVKKTVGIKS